MDSATYSFESTAEIRLTKLLGIPRMRTPVIKLSGPTTVRRSKSTSPSKGRFRAETQLTSLDLHGKLLGVDVSVALNNQTPSMGIVEGRADPASPDPTSPEPAGALRSDFDVFFTITTPFGTLENHEPVGMRARIDAVPPPYARYRQYSPPRSLYDKFVGILIAEALHATHIVRLEDPRPGPGPKPQG